MSIDIIKPGFEIITPEEHIKDYMKILEKCARNCYRSEDRIGPGTDMKMVRMIRRLEHESVMEHCAITVNIIGDRAMSHQLVRHRLGAYSQESQRYCNYGKKGLRVIQPPSISGALGDIWKECIESHYEIYLNLLEQGIPPEDARSVLPNATATQVYTTFNLRQWRHVFKDRALNEKAQWQIREIMQGILDEFKVLLPAIFEDLEYE